MSLALENRLVVGATEAYERQNLQYTADEIAARANRYELEIDRLRNGTPRQICVQLMDALQGCDDTAERAMAVAVRRNDYAELGKLLMAELEKSRHLTAEAVSE